MDPDPGNYVSSIFLLDQLPWWPELTLEFILFGLLIMISFMASSAEVAFFSLTKAEIDDLKDDESKKSQQIWRLFSKPDRIDGPKQLLATILITNNFVNVAAILVASNILRTFGSIYEWGDSIRFLLEVVVITSVLLFFGEIIPKVYAARYKTRLVNLMARPFEVLKRVFRPLSRTLIRATKFIDRRVQLKETHVSLVDLKHAIDLTTTDIADKEEKEILKGIVNFGNIPVKSIMRARVDVVAVDIHTPLEELVQFINDQSYSRLPVYEESLDNIQGILHIKDLLPYLKSESIPLDLPGVLREVYFIPESKKIDGLLADFKSQRLHMAIVVDEFGGTAGLVTLEDVIEEIFGEINDEFDSEDWVYTKMSENTYIFEGRISLNDVKKILDLSDEIFEDARGDSDSLGGLILELHGKIPDVGDLIQYQNFDLHVEAISKNRISMIKFVINEEALSESENQPL